MRLDAKVGDTGWLCFDVERCAVVPNVRWIDTETAQWGEIVIDVAYAKAFGDLPIKTHQERRIDVIPARRFVLFNQIDDDAADETPVDAIAETSA